MQCPMNINRLDDAVRLLRRSQKMMSGSKPNPYDTVSFISNVICAIVIDSLEERFCKICTREN